MCNFDKIAGAGQNMYHCKCGHHRCKKYVSRSTWYRHKLASILQQHVDLDDEAYAEPLPVEEAAQAEEDLRALPDPAVDEVNILSLS